MSVMSISIVRGVRLFAQCEHDFLRELSARMTFEAFDRGEHVVHTNPTLCIVVHGTLVVGGQPISSGDCMGMDVVVRSAELHDRRLAVALTYCEVCALTKSDIDATAADYPASARQLRWEAFKIAMHRSAQLLGGYLKRRRETDKKQPDLSGALLNLGEEVSSKHAEIHAFFRAINGGVKMRGLACEVQQSTDKKLASKAREAFELMREAQDTARANKVLIDEDGNPQDEQSPNAIGKETRTPQEKLLMEVQDEMHEMRQEMQATMRQMQAQSAVAMAEMRDEMRRLILGRQGQRARPRGQRTPAQPADHGAGQPQEHPSSPDLAA